MIRRRLLLTLLFALFALNLPAQRIESLREEIKQAEEEIKMIDSLLSKNQKSQKTTTQQLNLIVNKIKNRQSIISNLEKQSGVIESDIGAKNTTIQSLEQNLGQLRKEYAAMVYDSYKNYRLNNFMLFLFASRDFNDATLRIAYMHRYNRMRENKAAEIDSVSTSLGREISILKGQKEELDKVKQTRNVELTSLDKDQEQYRSSSQKLKQEAGKLNSDIKAKRDRIERMQRQIRQIIAEESRKYKTQPQTSEQREYNDKLSGQFDQNMGKLPYPARGVVVTHFGDHSAASWQYPGIGIATEPGAEVRSVFEGEVSNTFFIQGMNNCILIRHGNYFTFYGNLGSFSVKKGDRVSLNQSIGRVGPADDDGDCTLHFGVWKQGSQTDAVSLDPEKWLKR